MHLPHDLKLRSKQRASLPSLFRNLKKKDEFKVPMCMQWWHSKAMRNRPLCRAVLGGERLTASPSKLKPHSTFSHIKKERKEKLASKLCASCPTPFTSHRNMNGEGSRAPPSRRDRSITAFQIQETTRDLCSTDERRDGANMSCDFGYLCAPP
ncbi:hypothetical protein CDAR_389991 [Caerostris darwini]|uniref:Uncharacterized protein n=1 Tax=Caerostris darwini TaxID=1538125 RepID=A0AAV4QX28_9ARAC|nr:hypothetical protein CDAR_389991 [Caerostris darwini]